MGAQPDHQTAQAPGCRTAPSRELNRLDLPTAGPPAGWFRRMPPATVLDIRFAGASVIGLVIGDQQHAVNLLRVLDGEPFVAREGIVGRPERLGRGNRLTSQCHAFLVDRAGVHRGVGIFVGAVEAEAEMDLVTFGGHLRVGLKAPANDRGGDAERLPIRVHDLHPDTGPTALRRRVGAAPGRAAGQGENHQSRRGNGEYPCGEHRDDLRSGWGGQCIPGPGSRGCWAASACGGEEPKRRGAL